MAITGTEVTVATSGVGTNGGYVIVPIAQLLSVTTVSGSPTLTSSALFGTIGPGWAMVGTNIAAGAKVGQIQSTSSLLMVTEQSQIPANATGSGTQTISFNSHEQRALNDPYPCIILNTSSSATLYLGGKSVNNTGGSIGFPLAPNTSIGIDLAVDDVLWGIASTGSITVGVLIGRQ